MMPILTILFFGSILAFIVILAAIIWFFARISGAGQRETRADEARLAQELHQGLEKMEARIEALETILLENQNRKGERP
ncbi:MAG: phage shock protein B [Desulfobulbaceae bacterium]|jgi:phage shock protein B|nr:phage shock protein B [Desulfobulbaceae bacterium]